MDYSTIFVHGNVFVLFALAFLGGFLASISPCSLAMVPIIVGYIGGYSDAKPTKTLLQMLAFILGASVIFTIIGILCALTGKVFIANPYFTMIVVSIIIIMGLKLIGFLDFDMPVVNKEMPKSTSYNQYIYPIILGFVFALVGTPCSTPILAGIMAFASLSANLPIAVMMLFLFSLGQGIIFIFAGFLTSRLKAWKNFYKISDILMKICGWLLIITGLYIFYKIFYALIVK